MLTRSLRENERRRLIAIPSYYEDSDDDHRHSDQTPEERQRVDMRQKANGEGINDERDNHPDSVDDEDIPARQDVFGMPQRPETYFMFISCILCVGHVSYML